METTIIQTFAGLFGVFLFAYIAMKATNQEERFLNTLTKWFPAFLFICFIAIETETSPVPLSFETLTKHMTDLTGLTIGIYYGLGLFAWSILYRKKAQ